MKYRSLWGFLLFTSFPLGFVQSTNVEAKNEVLIVRTPAYRIDTAKIVVPTKRIEVKKKRAKFECGLISASTFMGFPCERVDTTITNELKEALGSYSGPPIKITSLRRHYNHKSDHFHGKALDASWCEDLIWYLVSDEGQSWLKNHGLMFYIESKTRYGKATRFLNFPETKKYVFVNPSATGDHIHIGLEG